MLVSSVNLHPTTNHLPRTWFVWLLRINLIHKREPHPKDYYGSSWSIYILRINLIHIHLADQLDPCYACFIHKPTSYYGSSTLYLIRMLNPVTYPKVNLLNPYADQLKHITNQKTSRNKNHGEKRLTSMSTVEHALNAVKAKLQSNAWQTWMKKKTTVQQEAERPKKSRVREGRGGTRCTDGKEKEKRNVGVAPFCFKKNTQGYFCPLT